MLLSLFLSDLMYLNVQCMYFKFINFIVFIIFSGYACRAKVVNFLRKTFTTINDAEEELAINYKENRPLDDSGFQELPCMPSSAYSMEKFQHLYISNFTEEQLVSLWKKIVKKSTSS